VSQLVGTALGLDPVLVALDKNHIPWLPPVL